MRTEALETLKHDKNILTQTNLICETGRKNVDKILSNFWKFLEEEITNIPNSKACAVFISILLSFEKVVLESNTQSASELFTEISAAKDILMMSLSNEEPLKKLISEYGVTNISIAPICRIFESSSLRLFIEENTNSPFEVNILHFKTILSEKINNFINNLIKGTNKIIHLSLPLFTKDRMTILTFGYSEIIEILLDNAWENYNKHYSLLIVLPSADILNEEYSSIRNQLILYHHNNINQWKERMKIKGVSVSLISMDSIYNAINIVDFVLLNAECILENGSIIGISGTAVISSIAKVIFNKPVYIITHAAKFIDIVPFNMKINNILSEITFQNQQLNNNITSIVDLSENSHITMFFTDIGAMTPYNIAFESKLFISY